MSLDGLEKLMPGYSPRPPKQPPLLPDGSRPPISVADGATFDAWMALPSEDLRTLAEFAANPVPLVRRLPVPNPPPPSTPPVITGYLKASFGHTMDCDPTTCDISGDEYLKMHSRHGLEP